MIYRPKPTMFKYFFAIFFVSFFCTATCFAAPPPQVIHENEIRFAGGDVEFGSEPKGFMGDTIKAISQKVHTESVSWAEPLKKIATILFMALMSLSLVWTLIEMALRQGSVGEIFAELTKNLIFFGLFLCVLQNADDIAGVIYNTFSKLGSESGKPWASNSGSVAGNLVDIGANYLGKIGEWISDIYSDMGVLDAGDAVKTLPYALLSITVGFLLFLVCALMCVKILVAEATLWIIMYGGIFVLGFGGSKWTKDIAVSYLKTVMAMSFAYFGMLLVANILIADLEKSYGRFAINISHATDPGKNVDEEWFIMIPEFAFTLILYFIMDKIPQIFSSMINGMHFTAGPSSFASAAAAMSVGASRVMAGPKALAGAAVGTAKAAGKSMQGLYKGVKALKNGGAANALKEKMSSARKAISNEAKSWGKDGYKYTNKSASKLQAKDSQQNRSSDLNDYKPGGARYNAMNSKNDSGGQKEASKENDPGPGAASKESSQAEPASVANESQPAEQVKTADGSQKPNESSKESGQTPTQNQPQTGYFEQLEKEIASNAEKKAQESSSQNDSGQTFTAQDANKYEYYTDAKKDFPNLKRSEWEKATKESSKNFTAKDANRYEDIYDARKDYPHLERSDWNKATKESYKNFSAQDASRYKDIYDARNDYPHLDIDTWQNARIKSTLTTSTKTEDI